MAKKKDKLLTLLNRELDPFRFCCGVVEVGDLTTEELYQDEMDEYDERHSTIAKAGEIVSDSPCEVATTIPRQRREIAALKALGFRKVLSFTNGRSGTGNRVTMWAKGNPGSRISFAK